MKYQYFSLLLFVFIGISCKKETESITPKFLQKKLVGSWTGVGSTSYNDNRWNATIIIEENGHYTGQINSVTTGDIEAILDHGDDNLDHPGKRIIIQSVDAFDSGNGKISFVHPNGNLITFPLEDLVFSSNYKSVKFTVYDYRVIYELTKD